VICKFIENDLNKKIHKMHENKLIKGGTLFDLTGTVIPDYDIPYQRDTQSRFALILMPNLVCQVRSRTAPKSQQLRPGPTCILATYTN